MSGRALRKGKWTHPAALTERVGVPTRAPGARASGTRCHCRQGPPLQPLSPWFHGCHWPNVFPCARQHNLHIYLQIYAIPSVTTNPDQIHLIHLFPKSTPVSVGPHPSPLMETCFGQPPNSEIWVRGGAPRPRSKFIRKCCVRWLVCPPNVCPSGTCERDLVQTKGLCNYVLTRDEKGRRHTGAAGQRRQRRRDAAAGPGPPEMLLVTRPPKATARMAVGRELGGRQWSDQWPCAVGTRSAPEHSPSCSTCLKVFIIKCWRKRKC